MAVGYTPRSSSNKASAPTPFHHPPRPLPERSRTAPTAPVSVPNIQQAPPPPLPPPRYVNSGGQDLGWQMANAEQIASSNNAVRKSTPVKAGSSLQGHGQHQRPEKSYKGPERRVDFTRKEVPRSAPTPSLLSTLKAQRTEPLLTHNLNGSSDPQVVDLSELLEYNKLRSERQMSKDSLERSSQAYDKQLLSRIGNTQQPSSPNAGGLGETSSAPADTSNTLSRLNGQLLSLSTLKQRSGTTTPPSAISSAFSPRMSGLHSPLTDSGLDYTHPLPSFSRQQQQPSSSPHTGRPIHVHTSASRNSSVSGSVESPTSVSGRFSINPDHSLASFRNLRVGSQGYPGHNMSEPATLGDYQNTKTGQKRRAQSPPSETAIDPNLPADAVEPWQRANNNSLQLGGGRGSQAARFLQQSQPQSASSVSTSASSGARNSYSSSLGVSSSAGTSYTSDRVSPTLYQAAGDVSKARTQSLLSAYQHAQSTHAPTSSPPSQAQVLALQGQQVAQAQTPSLATSTYLHRENNSGILRAPGLWICDCCPKKPKKFESEEELRIHEMEKQYICQYCHNRFKNKNEAERHQNSLHLRRHSWSCSALSTFEAAFHPTPVNNLSVHFNRLQQEAGKDNEDPNSPAYQRLQQAATDTCGYCGQEFLNPPNWDERIEHLNHVHKFGECNQNKKFFRADHFRQHLKHSHAGTSGKWTNVLENACMKDEPPPQPIAPGMMPGVPNAMPGGVPGIAMVGQQALLAAHQLQQQQAAQQAVQQQQQQQTQPPPNSSQTAPQATMASILSSALGHQSSPHTRDHS